MAVSPPPELATAIQNASAQYGVPPDILSGVWSIEAGNAFPNPYVNSSGYGGLFGTHDWNGPTQEQANYAASILHNLAAQYGNWTDALSHYSGGGYSSVPGETSGGSDVPSNFVDETAALAGNAGAVVTGAVNAAKGVAKTAAGGAGSLITVNINPFKWLTDWLQSVTVDAKDLLIRGLLIGLGIVLVIIAVDHFTDGAVRAQIEEINDATGGQMGNTAGPMREAAEAGEVAAA